MYAETWMTCNFLPLSGLSRKHLRDTLCNDIATSDDITLASSTTVRNPGDSFDQDLSFSSIIKYISRTVLFHLQNIAKIRNILSQKDGQKLVNGFVTSRLDYCISLLSCCPNKSLNTIQLIQYAAARVLTRTQIREPISPI